MADELSVADAPLVSVVVAARNEARRIGQCLESLLAQSYRPLEVLVVDDGSTDGTADVVRRFPSVRLLAGQAGGQGLANNLGAAAASGAIVLFLDADMFFDARFVELMVAPIVAGECLGTCHGTEVVANPENEWAACLQAFHGLPRERRVVLTPAQLAEGSEIFRAIRRADFLRVGGFDDIGYMDDRTLFPKLGVRARYVEQAVCHHYNLETLGEVMALGRWASRTLAHMHGRRAVVRYLPIFSVPRAARHAIGKKMPALFVFEVVHDAGVCWGLLAGKARQRK